MLSFIYAKRLTDDLPGKSSLTQNKSVPVYYEQRRSLPENLDIILGQFVIRRGPPILWKFNPDVL